VVVELGLKINPEKDRILVEGREIQRPERMVYIMLNKPAGVVASAKKTTQEGMI
jgi:23S rRNA pseudouridine2605 synthase